MAKLNDADAIYMGADEALKVMLGATQVWAPPPDAVAPSFVQQAGAASSGTQFKSATFGASTTSGNTIVVAVGWGLSSEGDLLTEEIEISDNKGNTYEKVASIASTSSSSGSTFAAGIFVAKDIVGGAGHQVNAGHPTEVSGPGFSAIEISGANATAPVSDSSALKDTSSPYVAGEVDVDSLSFVVLSMACGGSPSSFGATGFTNAGDYSDANWWPTGAAYLRAPSGPTLAPSVSIPGGNAPALVVAVLKQ